MNSPSPSEPERLVHSEQPYNAEPSLARLRASFLTPQHAFYVRSHGDVPALDEAHHRLYVSGRVSQPLELSLEELRERFPWRTVTAVMQCAGNRRAELGAVWPVSGDPWRGGAIGNAEWMGVSLADVLRAAGAERGEGLHVAFESYDEVTQEGETFPYGVSIPMGKALSPEVLLAFELNGEPLTPEHGYPLRAVVPGYAGVRSPKWLVGIDVRDKPSDTPLQHHDYKLFPPNVRPETADWEAGITINDMPLNSVICEPAAHARLAAGPTRVAGYAIATGREVVRVDVSLDGGRRWHQAALERHPDSPWSWTFWQLTLELPRGPHELVVRAWDSAGQTQPARPDDTWNFKGYLCAAWHRLPVEVY